MTFDEIVRSAADAGYNYPAAQHYTVIMFAKMIAAAERKACLGVCQDIVDKETKSNDYKGFSWAEECYLAIRERGRTK